MSHPRWGSFGKYKSEQRSAERHPYSEWEGIGDEDGDSEIEMRKGTERKNMTCNPQKKTSSLAYVVPQCLSFFLDYPALHDGEIVGAALELHDSMGGFERDCKDPEPRPCFFSFVHVAAK